MLKSLVTPKPPNVLSLMLSGLGNKKVRAVTPPPPSPPPPFSGTKSFFLCTIGVDKKRDKKWHKKEGVIEALIILQPATRKAHPRACQCI